MRIIYKILIGMLIFNGIYIAIAPAFPSGELVANDPELMDDAAKYQNIGGIDLGSMLITGVGVFTGAIVVGALSRGAISISLGTIIGCSTIASIIAGLWRGMSGVFQPMLEMGGSIASQFYTIFVIVLGIIAALTISEMFSGQSGVDV